jgi:parallel beta-helix repeat protein
LEADASWTNLANPSSWSFRDIIGQPLDALPRRVTRTVSASANVNGLDDLILVSGNSTLTLESAVGCDGRRHTFFKSDSSATTMTIGCSGSETIDGSVTLSTAVQYAGFDVFSDGTNWHAQRVGIDLLSFQQAGTGALVRTALAKMREWVSLKDFAVGDGSTNDTTAINNWLTQITGKTGYIPEGTYMTNGGHSLPSNTVLMGAGKRIAVLKLRSGVSANTRMFVNSDTSGGNSGITLRDFTMDGNRSANSAVSGLDGMVGQNVTHSQFLNLRVTGFTHHCFDFSVGNSDNLWDGNELDDYGTSSIGFGVVVLSDCHRNRMIGNRVQSSLTNVGLAIDDQSGGTGGTPCTNNVIQGNTILGTDYGIMVVGSHRNTVQGNTVKSPTNFGIIVTPSTDAPNNAIGNTVIGNTVDVDNGVNAFGILVAGTGNRVYGNSVNRGQVGIYIQDEAGASLQSTDIIVSGNYCVSPSLYGIQVAGGANISVTDNDIVSSADRGITVTPVNTQATPRGILIARNKTRNSQQEGIAVEANAEASVQEVVVTENLNVDGGLAGTATYASILITQATSAMSRISVFDNRSVSTTATVWARNVQVSGTVTEYDVVRNLYWGYTPTGADPNTAFALTVANEATDTTCFPLFVTAATGDVEPKANTGLTFNSNTGALGAVTLTSTVSTGTAPLAVSSTTKVSNLNADLLDDQTGSYYLDSANFTGTNWTDLTDGGTTTLHTHTSGTSSAITVANEATDTTCFPVFVTAATGDLGPKSNAGLAFDSSTGTLTATAFVGPLTGNVTGNVSGTAATVTGAAQTAITSVGTLTALQVDNVNINGNTISSTAGTDLLITPLAGQQLILDGTIEIDAGVVTGATSISSTSFVGALTGNASTATALETARTIGGTSFNGTANIVPSTTTVADEATDTSCFVTFVTAATGDLQEKTNANLTFNSSTGVLTSASLVATTADINGGTVDGATVGASSASTGSFTTLTASGTVTLSGTGANIATGSNFISNGGTDAGLSFDASNHATLSSNLIVSGTAIDNAFSGALYVSGPIVAHHASSLLLEQVDSTTSRIRAYGADAATAGILKFTVIASDGAPSFTHTLGADGSIVHPGLVDLSDSAAGQIKFPATQNASADANTLDDYEEGTFTPAVTFGGAAVGVTYSVQVGFYTKIGDRIFFDLQVTLSSNGSSTGSFAITGLPVASANTTNRVQAVTVRANALTGITGQVQGNIGVNQTQITLTYLGTGTATDLSDTTVTDTANFRVSGHYGV